MVGEMMAVERTGRHDLDQGTKVNIPVMSPMKADALENM